MGPRLIELSEILRELEVPQVLRVFKMESGKLLLASGTPILFEMHHLQRLEFLTVH